VGEKIVIMMEKATFKKIKKRERRERAEEVAVVVMVD
jgi:hypothetical protein